MRGSSTKQKAIDRLEQQKPMDVYLIMNVGMHGAPATHSIDNTTQDGTRPRHSQSGCSKGPGLHAIVQTNRCKFAAV
jgi:hypothetical protein